MVEFLRNLFGHRESSAPQAVVSAAAGPSTSGETGAAAARHSPLLRRRTSSFAPTGAISRFSKPIRTARGLFTTTSSGTGTRKRGCGTSE